MIYYLAQAIDICNNEIYHGGHAPQSFVKIRIHTYNRNFLRDDINYGGPQRSIYILGGSFCRF